jgi:hypothetical protein
VDIYRVAAPSVLRLELRVGVNASGSPVLRRRNLANVKSNATDLGLYEVALALGQLQEYPVYGITRVDSVSLIEG